MTGGESRVWRGIATGLVIFGGAILNCTAPATAADALDLNDVSVLFDPPEKVADLDALIRISDLKAGGEQIWSAAAFAAFVRTAGSNDAKIGGKPHRISLKRDDTPELNFTRMENWHIVAFRIDPGAPGLSPMIIEQFGQSPQIRLTLQPVHPIPEDTENNVQLEDITAHLIFSFTKPLDLSNPAMRPQPDEDTFNTIAADLVALKKQLASGAFGGARINTVGKKLQVHPGLADKRSAIALRGAFKAFLEKHLRPQRLAAMAMMGLPDGAPKPWIFVAMQGVPPGLVPQLPNGGFVTVANPTSPKVTNTAQMLSFVDADNERVMPTPKNFNQSAITCRHNRPMPGGANLFPPDQRGTNGLATAELFKGGDEMIKGKKARARANLIVDTIADPTKSHFFNTDCVSCHTETTRATIRLDSKSRIKDIEPMFIPTDNWNLRMFGWFGSRGGGFNPATITRRTKNETKEVVKFLNEKALNR